MKLEGDLRAKANDSGQSVELLRANGEHVLSYEHLVVKDADGTKLEASMGAIAGRIWLEVDDSNAKYPVTIDPAFVQQTFIKASNTDPGDGFGAAVAISGDTLVVGAPGESSNATGINGDQSDNSHGNAGAVYVFVRTNGVWAQQAYLKPPDTSQAQFFFGQAVAISGDTIVVGRPGIFSGSAGVAYVFVRSGVTWSQQASLIPSDVGPSDNFGFSVAIEGDTAVIGAPFPEGPAPNPDPRPGFAFVFVRNGVTWAEQAKLMASNANTYDGFGWSVALSGNTIVVGAQNEDSNSTGINGDGGNNLALNAGASYVFVRSGVTWSQQAYIKASNTDALDHFGASVGIAGDTVVVGAPGESSNATGINGNQIDNSVSGAGAVYVFVRSGMIWSQQAYIKASNTDAFDVFGSSIAIQGETMIVGAYGEASNARGVDGDQSNNSASNAGAAYYFVRSGVNWSQQAYLKASNTHFNDHFGNSVGLSGGTLIVGAPYESSDAIGINGDGNDLFAANSGAAYVFVAFSLTNNQPSIFSVDVTPQQGSPFVNSQIARVSDIEDAQNTLTVTINGSSSATVNGVTVTLNPTSPNATSQVFADVAANCTATPANFTLRVTDSGGLINESILTVLIKPNDLPLLGTYVVTSVAAGSSFNVTPSAIPSDNGSVDSVTVNAAPASFTGMATVNQSSGLVSITNANPPGVYTMTVTATDNCGVTFSKDFRLTVNSATGCTILVNSTAQEVTHANPNGITNGNCTLGEAILTANTGVQVDGCSCSGGGSPYIIVLANTTYTLSARHNADYGFNGLPSITSEITIQSNGAIIERSTAAGTPTFRLINVSRVGDLTLQNVTLQGGLAKGGNGGDSDVNGGGGGAGLGGGGDLQSRQTDGNEQYVNQ